MSLIEEMQDPQERNAPAYIALARKWRPRSFDEVAGQQHVVKALRNSIGAERIHHAYLLSGTRGIGKTTIARILAKTFSCSGSKGGEACGQCSICEEIDSGSHPDVLEMDAASNTGVADIRQLLDSAAYMPSSGPFRIFIIDEAHMLSTQACNAMLKTLEEPPPHIKFILATTDPQKLPVTVLSRCLQFNLKRIEPDVLKKRIGQILEKEEVPFDDDAVAVVAEQAEGSLRDALSLLDQLIAHGGGKLAGAAVREAVGLVKDDIAKQLLAAVRKQNHADIHGILGELYDSGASIDGLLRQIAATIHRDAMEQSLRQTGSDSASEQERATLQVLYEIALNARRTLAYGPDPRAGAEMALLRMSWYVAHRDGAGQDRLDPAAQAPSPPVQAPPPRTSAALPTTDEGWKRLVASLEEGLPKSAAKSCAFVSGGPGDVLNLTATAASLSSANLLGDALRKHFGRPVKVNIGSERGESTTMMEDEDAQEAAEQKKRMCRAREHPDIRRMLDMFRGAQIQSVQPTDHERKTHD